MNTAISKGNEWTIAKELELGGYIVSGAYSTDNKSTLAIFEPTGNGDYKFSTSTNRNSDEIIVGGVAINGEWYDLIWFNGAKTEYAEITYTINGQVQDTLRYNTDDMDIISIKNPEKEYSIHVDTNKLFFIEKIAKPAEPVNGQDERRISCAAVDSPARLC